MELFFTPSTLIALGTLVLLEVVLGIDNLLFIAILAEKLPPEKRDKARMVGLMLAMFMRLGLLCIISWVVSLTTSIFSIKGHPVSWRDIILVSGGFFLLFKATRELHERLESKPHEMAGTHEYAGFWVVVAQIVVLDAVFSLDAVITAVGMVEHLSVMMVAVVIAIGIMLLAAKPLAIFVNEHPTVVVLCLSFLLLIGLSLIAEGAGIHLPKGYLYAAIGFSVLIETFNQIAASNIRKHQVKRSMRARTAEAVLRLLGTASQPSMATAGATAGVGGSDAGINNEGGTHTPDHEEIPVFASEEVDMVGRVLALSERTARSIMTYRGDTVFLDLENSIEDLKQQLFEGTPDIVPVCRNGLDNLVGVAYAVDILSDIVQHHAILPETLQEPIIVPETMRVNKLLNTLRGTTLHLVLVADEYGSIEGVVTLMDVFEAIAGDLPEEGEPLAVVPMGEGKWRIAGSMDVHYLEIFLDLPEIMSESNDYTSLAGFLLFEFGNIPVAGDTTTCGNYTFTVVEVSGHRITLVDVERKGKKE